VVYGLNTKEKKPMATLEERVQALEREHEQLQAEHKRLQVLEQEHTQLKKTIELQTIAIRALVSKEAFEKLQETVEKSQEQNGKLFDVLNNHNIFTNERLGDIQNQIIELDNKLDGKIVGLQIETRQHFNRQDSKIAALDNKVTGLQATQAEHTTLLQEILKRLPEK
jgi:polyhydroxyalkanoate synthesis regulator phasin